MALGLMGEANCMIRESRGSNALTSRSGQLGDFKVRNPEENAKAAGKGQVVPIVRSSTPVSGTAVEGEEAVELYAAEIARNLNVLNRQVGLLRDEYAEAQALLRKIK